MYHAHRLVTAIVPALKRQPEKLKAGAESRSDERGINRGTICIRPREKNPCIGRESLSNGGSGLIPGNLHAPSAAPTFASEPVD